MSYNISCVIVSEILSLTLHSYQGITASEYACEGEFVEEAALPVPSEPRNLEAAKPNATDMFLILSEGPTTLCLDCQSESSQVGLFLFHLNFWLRVHLECNRDDF